MNKYLLEHTFDIIQGEITTLIPLSGLHVWLLRDTQDYLFNTKQKALKEKKKVVVIFSFYSKLTGTNKKNKIKTFRHRKLWSLVKPQFLLMRFSYKLLKVSAGWRFNCPTTPTVCTGWQHYRLRSDSDCSHESLPGHRGRKRYLWGRIESHQLLLTIYLNS